MTKPSGRAPTLNLVGAGNVGQTLGRLFAQAGVCDVQDILNRSPQKAVDATAFIGAGHPVQILGEMRPADIWMVTVPDTQIAGIAADLVAGDFPPAIAFHCSGFLPAAEMAPLDEKGWHLGSAHPVTSFADPTASVAQFAGTFCGLEGAGQALSALETMFTAVGAWCFPVRSDAKAIYHAAAVLSNNLTTVLQAAAQEAWAEAGVPDDAIDALHAALLKSTLENTLALGPQAALTGPAARGDMAVVTRQNAAIAQWHPEAGQAYDALSKMAAQLKRTGRTR